MTPSRRLWTLGALWAAVGCGGDSTGPPPTPVVRVVVTPRVDSLRVGDSLQLTAVPQDANGVPLTGRVLTWSSSDTAKAVVAASGWVHARTGGSFTIIATSETRRGAAWLSAQHPVAAVTLPDSLPVRLSSSVLVVPALRSAGGGLVSGRPVSWSNLDPGILTLSASGGVTPVQIGLGRIVATSEGKTDTGSVLVVPNPISGFGTSPPGAPGFVPLDSSVQVGTFVQDSAGGSGAGWVITWASSDTTLMQVAPTTPDGRTALVTGRRLGIAQLSLSIGAQTGHTTVQVRPPVSIFSIFVDSLTLQVGQSFDVFPYWTNGLGGVVGPPNQPCGLLTSSDTAIAAVLTGGWTVQARSPGRAVVVCTSGAASDTAILRVTPVGVSHITLALGRYRVFTPDSLELHVVDDNGQPVAKQLTITSSDTTVIKPIETGFPLVADTFLHIAALRSGQATVTIATDSFYLTKILYVDPAYAVALSLSSPPAAIRVGDSTQFTGSATWSDAQVHYVSIGWSSSDSGLATVTDSGVVHAAGSGQVWIIGRVGDAADSVQLLIGDVSSPVIDSVAPATLIAGDTATVFGTGFAPSPGANQVNVNGTAATVLQASATTLKILLGAAATTSCHGAGDAWLSVTSNGSLAAQRVPYTVARLRSLAADQWLLLDAASARCISLIQLGHYRVALVNAASTADTSLDYRFTIMGSAPYPVARLKAAPHATLPDSLRQAIERHRIVLEGDADFARRTGPAPLRPIGLAGPMLSIGDSVADLVRLRVPRIDFPDFCGRYTSIGAKRLYTGAHVTVYKDTISPLGNFADTLYISLAKQFDTVMYPLVVANFGDPLAFDASLDRDGRVGLLFSPVVNTVGAGGFVTACDFYPDALAPSSNEGEMVYLNVPTDFGLTFTGNTMPVWWWLVRSTLMHEATHVAQLAQRFSHGSVPDDPWLEEAGAAVGEELWARGIYGTAWRGNATYAQTLYCDVRPTTAPCVGRPYAMFNNLQYLYYFDAELAYHTPLGRDGLFYGAAWSLLRWTVDQYASTESGFLKALTVGPERGTANLQARTGHAFDELLSDWELASILDDRAGPPLGSPLERLPSWNTPDIFVGMNQDFPADFPSLAPIQVFAAPFLGTALGTLTGGSLAWFELGLLDSTVALDVHAPNGAPLPSSARLLIYRFP